MPRTVGLVQLHFHAGLDFMNLDSPVGSCFKQFLVDICDTVPCDYMLAGPHLDDPEKALVMIGIPTRLLLNHTIRHLHDSCRLRHCKRERYPIRAASDTPRLRISDAAPPIPTARGRLLLRKAAQPKFWPVS